jgi:hypothetical protein
MNNEKQSKLIIYCLGVGISVLSAVMTIAIILALFHLLLSLGYLIFGE